MQFINLIALNFMMEDTGVDNGKFVLTALYRMTSREFHRQETLGEYLSLYRELTNNRNPFLNRGKDYTTPHFIGFVYGLLYDELPAGYRLANEDMEIVQQGLELGKSIRAPSNVYEG